MTWFHSRCCSGGDYSPYIQQHAATTLHRKVSLAPLCFTCLVDNDYASKPVRQPYLLLAQIIRSYQELDGPQKLMVRDQLLSFLAATQAELRLPVVNKVAQSLALVTAKVSIKAFARS